MSIGPKDAMFVAGIVAGTAGSIIYTNHKVGQMKKELEDLRNETRALAKYIELLETRLGNGGHRHHHVQTPQPHQPHYVQTPQQPPPNVVPPRVAQPPVHIQQPQQPSSTRRPPNNPQVKVEEPKAQPSRPARRFQPQEESDEGVMVSSKRRVEVPKDKEEAVESSEEEEEEQPGEDSDDDEAMADLVKSAKSGTRNVERFTDGGQQPHNVGNKANMERTRQIAAALQKRREQATGAK